MKLTTCGNSCDACKAYKGDYEKLDEREALSAAPSGALRAMP